ncbi:xanthine dehydrogenase molybdopterin binding subunit [Derxia gummosa]|uniref:Xanthine dehydrogenase molybdopterin binding subunit n=1 Tax=Derxia gummosa DSM 723 TaxID=1121388 RepID=A0A8B6X9E3_9BURK|nr:xanthine dehydrogenase molybdopterin binding subunit [Derxia gummosa]
MNDRLAEPPVGTAQKHESAPLHVTGAARYTDDILLPAGALHIAFGCSPVAHGRLIGLDLSAVEKAPGVVTVLTAADIPGHNNYGAVLHDDPVFVTDEVMFVGHQLFAVVATSHDAARRAALLARIEIDELPALLDIRAAVAAQSFVLPTETVRRGDADAAIAAAPHRLSGSHACGGQEHFYLEGQIAAALPQEDGSLVIHCSTQHPSEVQHMVAEVMALPVNAVTVQCRRMGGGFGGKESQPALMAAVAALAARKTGRACKLRLDRDADMTMTGKRHDFVYDYEAGFDDAGRLLGVKFMFASRCGYSADLSGPVNDRAIFHADNAYYLPAVEIVSHRARTHTVSNTAYRGFGGPQGMVAIEAVLDDIARTLGRDPLDVRRANLYGGEGRDTTHYGMQVEDNLMPEMLAQLTESAEYADRRAAIAEFNARSAIVKRGIAFTPVKFGISFTALHYNQAGALVHIYNDGTVLLNHGGTEMGQGLFTKVRQIVAQELGLPLDAVKASATDTSKVPNTSATAASSGSDLNGKAAQAAAVTLRERLVAFGAEKYGVAPTAIHFANGQVHLGERVIGFGQFAKEAYLARVQLSATGFYRTPKIHFDRKTWTGRPFYYFAWGAAVSEVAIDTLTGETRLLRTDILHDVGSSLNPALDIGQIEGAFLQGAGWLTCEELWWDAKGRLRTHAPSTYKIPGVGDWPEQSSVKLFDRPNHEDTIYRSKAVGEPPFMLGMSVFHAIRDAVGSLLPAGVTVPLDAPATPEAVLRAVGEARALAKAAGKAA